MVGTIKSLTPNINSRTGEFTRFKGFATSTKLIFNLIIIKQFLYTILNVFGIPPDNCVFIFQRIVRAIIFLKAKNNTIFIRHLRTDRIFAFRLFSYKQHSDARCIRIARPEPARPADVGGQRYTNTEIRKTSISSWVVGVVDDGIGVWVKIRSLTDDKKINNNNKIIYHNNR